MEEKDVYDVVAYPPPVKRRHQHTTTIGGSLMGSPYLTVPRARFSFVIEDSEVQDDHHGT